MTPEIEKHLTANMYLSKKQIMINNFLGGLSWGLGSVIGATVVVGVLVYILKLFGVFNAFSLFLQNIQ